MSTAVVSLGCGVTPLLMALTSTPAPGAKNVPMPRPIHTAIWPVTTNSSMARPPTAPSLRKSPIAATPATRLKKMSGTTSILIDLIKKSPIHLMLSASGPQTQPVSTPRMSAVTTRCHSGISNHVRSKSELPQKHRHCEEPQADATQATGLPAIHSARSVDCPATLAMTGGQVKRSVQPMPPCGKSWQAYRGQPRLQLRRSCAWWR